MWGHLQGLAAPLVNQNPLIELLEGLRQQISVQPVVPVHILLSQIRCSSFLGIDTIPA